MRAHARAARNAVRATCRTADTRALCPHAHANPFPVLCRRCADECGVCPADYTAVLVAAVLALAALLFYAPGFGGRNWFTGPAPNLE